MVQEGSGDNDSTGDNIKVYAVWPGNSIRGEVVALTYQDHWLVFQRDKEHVHVWEVYKDPVKLHGKSRRKWRGKPCKTKFKAAGTYMSPRTRWRNGQWETETAKEDQGKKVATFPLDTEELWYEIIKDPLFHLRLGLI